MKRGLRAALGAAGALLLGACLGNPSVRPTEPAAGAAAEPGRLLLVTIEELAARPAPGAGSTRKGLVWSGAYQASANAQRVARALASDYGLRAVDAWPIGWLDVHCVVYRLPPGASREAMIRRLRGDRRVESVQPMQRFGSLAAPASDYRALQHSIGRLQVEAAQRWARGRGVRVAVIDTGVDLRHPQLAGRIVAHADVAGTGGQAFSADRHGTAVAGIIAGGGAGGYTGIAPAAELLAIKACWPLAPGALAAECNSFTLARALAEALDLGCDVVNLSLSGPSDPLLERLLRVALARGVTVVGALPAAASDPRRFPTGVPGVIAVRDADLGAPADGAVAAPGRDILSLAPGGGYEFQSGSSLSAAQVSGVVALLLERQRPLPPARLQALLAGPLVDACAALAGLVGATCPREALADGAVP